MSLSNSVIFLFSHVGWVNSHRVGKFSELTKENFVFLFHVSGIFGGLDAALNLLGGHLDVPVVGEALRLVACTASLVRVVLVELKGVILSFSHFRQKNAAHLFSSNQTGLENLNQSG